MNVAVEVLPIPQYCNTVHATLRHQWICIRESHHHGKHYYVSTHA